MGRGCNALAVLAAQLTDFRSQESRAGMGKVALFIYLCQTCERWPGNVADSEHVIRSCWMQAFPQALRDGLALFPFGQVL